MRREGIAGAGDGGGGSRQYGTRYGARLLFLRVY